MMKKILIFIFISGLLSLVSSIIVPQAFAGFELNVKATALGEINGIAGSNQNPQNRFAQLPDKGMIFTLKPDMSFVYDQWLSRAKPRLEVEYKTFKINFSRAVFRLSLALKIENHEYCAKINLSSGPSSPPSSLYEQRTFSQHYL